MSETATATFFTRPLKLEKAYISIFWTKLGLEINLFFGRFERVPVMMNSLGKVMSFVIMGVLMNMFMFKIFVSFFTTLRPRLLFFGGFTNRTIQNRNFFILS